jgi:hypothetical protein
MGMTIVTGDRDHLESCAPTTSSAHPTSATLSTIGASALVALVTFLIGVATSGTAATATSANPGTRTFTKAMIVVLENTDYETALHQPFLASLAKRGALLTNFTAEAHPSQPNYLALISGSTHNVASDGNVSLDGRHIGDLLEAKSLKWKAYAEGYPGNCFLGAEYGTYVRKHVPFLSFKSVQTEQKRCAQIVNASELAIDLQTGKLPDYSLFIPDLQNDGHDTGVAHADRWLRKTFGPLLENPDFMRGMLLIVTFDESAGSSSSSNHVATILVGDAIAPGTVLSANFNHYSLLRLIEDQFELGNLGQNDAWATSIKGLWK